MGSSPLHIFTCLSCLHTQISMVWFTSQSERWEKGTVSLRSSSSEEVLWTGGWWTRGSNPSQFRQSLGVQDEGTRMVESWQVFSSGLDMVQFSLHPHLAESRTWKQVFLSLFIEALYSRDSITALKLHHSIPSPMRSAFQYRNFRRIRTFSILWKISKDM